MPGPSTTSFQRPDLGILFEQLDVIAEREGFIGTKVLPILPVALQSAPFPKVVLESRMVDVKTRRAPGTAYAQVSGEFTQDSYATEEHGLEEVVDDRERRMYAQSLDLDMLAVRRIAGMLAREQERRIAAAVFNTTTWTGSSLTTAVGPAWTSLNSAAPIDDVTGAIVKVRDNTGANPMGLTGICSWTVFKNLRRNAQLIERVKYAGIDDPTMPWSELTAVLAKALGLKQLLVAGAVRNSASKGATRSLSEIWTSTYFMVAKIAETNDLRETCVGRTFAWEGDGGMAMGTAEEYRDEAVRSQKFRQRHDVLEKILYAECGHLLTGV